jgi:hypothetical protein
MLPLIRVCPSGRSLLQPIFKSAPFYQLKRAPHSCIRVPSQRFISSTNNSIDYPSSERNILDALHHQKHDKWGWVIYRTTYADNEAWTRFKKHITAQSHRTIAESDTPELEKSLEWTFIDDRASLEGASVPQLRECFKRWAAETFNIEQPRVAANYVPDREFNTRHGSPRYTSFIQVDEEALQSMIDEWGQPHLKGTGHVNLVRAHWKSMKKQREEDGEDECLEEEQGDHEPIDGCCEEDVGWMKIASTMVDANFYVEMNEPPPFWYLNYRRPPDIAYVY